MEWNKIFITGVENIDKQHKTLFNTITKLKKSTIDPTKSTQDDIHAILVYLVKYTKYHFSYEEKYMESINYVNLDEHKKVHRRFLVELKDIIIEYKTKGTYKEVQLYIFLVKWLQKHIAVEDQKYVIKD